MRGRRRVAEEAEEHPDERWMASYMDMVTVLMCMFIVLYAMSTVDQNKFAQLANSLATGFGAVNVGSIDTAKGVVVPADLIDKDAEGFTKSAVKADAATRAVTDAVTAAAAAVNAKLAQTEADDLSALAAQINANLAQAGVVELVDFKVDERGLTLGLVGSETFFAPDSDQLSVAAVRVLDAMAPVFAASARQVSVEGHADKHGQSVNFATDWELSSGRATQVLRHLVEHGGVGPGLIAAVGYGSARPASSGSSLSEMAMNRRVDIILLSNQPDTVRALIPAAVQDGPEPAPETETEPTTKTKTAEKPAHAPKKPTH